MADPNVCEVFSRPNQEARIHDLEQYTIWTDTPNRPGYRSRMSFGERNGAPRITVFTNSEEGPGVLVVGLHPVVFYQFLEIFKQVINSSSPTKREIDNLQPDPTVKIEKGMNRDNVNKVVKNTLVFGKNEDGVIWIGVQQKGAPNIAFKILPSVWHVFKKADGTPVTAQEMSAMTALQMIESLRNSMDRWTSRVKPALQPDPTKKKGGFGAADAPATTFDTSSDMTF